MMELAGSSSESKFSESHGSDNQPITPVSSHNHGDMARSIAPGGTQNNSSGDGPQFPGAIFQGPVNFAQPPKTPQELSLESQAPCLQSLAFLDMEKRLNDIGAAAEGTCAWLLQREEYMNWITNDRGLLSIEGKPGSGKSTLLKYALKNIEERFSGQGNPVILSFFFHGRGSELQKTPLGLFRSLLHQLLSEVPDALKNLLDQFEKRREKLGEPNKNWQWHVNELQDFFQSSLPEILESRPVWLFVDALDESSDDYAHNLASEFKTWLQNLPPSCLQFHILFTVRRHLILELEYGLNICLESETTEDISTYVEFKLSTKRKAPTTVIKLITDRASDVFLWARLVVERVIKSERQKVEWTTIEKEIMDIPEELHELYAEISSGTGIVQFIHQSVKDYFVDGGLSILENGVLSAETPKGDLVGRAHYQLSRSCLRYLAMEEMYPVKEITHLGASYREKLACDFPLFEYAMLSWALHASQSEMGGVPQDDILEYFNFPSEDFTQLLKRFSHMVYYPLTDGPRDMTSLLHIVSRYGLIGPLRAILRHAEQDGFDIDMRDTYGRTTLMWASIGGHADVVKLLLKIPEAEVNAKEGISLNPAKWPLFRRLFNLDKIDVNLKDNGSMTPLAYASKQGNKDVVELLLRIRGIDVNTRDKFNRRTPLMHAAMMGHKAVVKSLLKSPDIDINRANRYGQSPLSFAAQFGRDAMVELLLKTGRCDINSKDGWGRTPLMAVARVGHEIVVERLLEIKDRWGRTPLFLAVKWGDDTVVELLLKTGRCDINRRDNSGRTPLMAAITKGHKAVVERLLKLPGIDISVKDSTLLTYAICQGEGDMVKVLLDTGMLDINERDPSGRLPIDHATIREEYNTVKLLLDAGSLEAGSPCNHRVLVHTQKP
ncbi:uncharacterized protein GIQ15_04842 [Arthroderma uncinatum]|uniref:uncharacterized protein n=1 Tax=Arthroderma uncinatum TaxID=74035 RepID=UPI00144A73D6|nr:uncharacterized protein GIQ15_04842 [Arthroderma uncinatum]KAF3482083.1 hypothetical protein GIQ15_04842 [Arthroderma uncinatum]